jgi:mono/diheme cytochrome c family protein
MTRLTIRSPRSLLLALFVSMTVAACSDDSGGGKMDASGGKTDVASSPEAGTPDTVTADRTPAPVDSGVADAPGADALAADALAADAPVADALAADGGAVDLATKDTSIVDAPAVDTGSDTQPVDGGPGTLVARGKYLVDNIIACSDCHTPKTSSGEPDLTKYLAGNATFVKLPNGDVLPSRNLTPDKATGIGSFTAAQIKHMFMDGVVPAGDGGTAALNSVMPYYVFHNMASTDADAIVAYLQSIPAVVNDVGTRSASFDVPAPSDYLDPATIPTPADTYPQKDSALRGRYLATEIGLCIECHTPHLQSGSKPLDTGKYFWGGEDFSSFFAGTLNIHPVSANLTSDPATGLGNWTAAQIVTVLHQGVDDQGVGLCPPMPVGPSGAYGGITDQDALDIANYIKSLPPAVNDNGPACVWPTASQPMDGGGIDGATMDVSAIDSTTSG